MSLYNLENTFCFGYMKNLLFIFAVTNITIKIIIIIIMVITCLYTIIL